MQVILASQSPRRRELLGLFHIPFCVRVADIDETMTPGASAYSEVARVSHLKALAIPREPEDVVIAADTIVVCQGKILGKPHSKEEAIEMLTLLSGRDHQVMTGMTVLRGDRAVVCTEVTDLHFRELSPKEIARYVVDLVDATRSSDLLLRGGSPRATLATTAVAKAIAQLSGRDYVVPKDVQQAFAAAVEHRLQISPTAQTQGMDAGQVIRSVIGKVRAPKLR